MRDRINAMIKMVTSGLAMLGALGAIVMLIHIIAYVVMRHFMSQPIPATIEIVSNYYMVMIAFLPIAWAERRGDMISVEVFAPLFAGWLKKPVQIFVALITTGAYIALTYATGLVALCEFAAKSFVISLSIAIPIWPSYLILPLAFGLAAIVALFRIYLILLGDDNSGFVSHALEEEFSE